MDRILFGCVLLCFVGVGICQGQHGRMDSLRAVLKKEQEPVRRSDALHALLYELWDYDLEEAGRLAEESYQLAVGAHYTMGIVRGLTDIGMYRYYRGDYPQGSLYFHRAIAACQGKNLEDYPAYTLVRLGNLNRVQGYFDSATHYYNRARMYAGNHPDKGVLSSLYHNRGLLMLAVSKTDSALYYVRQSLDLRSTFGDSLLIGECWNSLGLAHRYLGEYDSAAHYYSLSIGVANRFDSPRLRILHYINQESFIFCRESLPVPATTFHDRWIF